jgi:NADPH-dependent curcumin reductase CurA
MGTRFVTQSRLMARHFVSDMEHLAPFAFLPESCLVTGTTHTKTIMKSREIHLKSRPQGMPKPENFELAKVDVPSPAEGEFLVRNEWLSVDPYMRGRMKEGKSYVAPFELDKPMEGGCVGKVVESKHPDFKEGDHVLGNMGWRECWKSNGEGVSKIDTSISEPKNFLSILGMTGMTAWVGLTKIGELKEGSQVFVSAASGAVGSTVCQIAKLMGCRVVGSSGSAEKIAWLKDKASIDEALNYKKVDDISAKLAELFPDGIDLYFDNVGGDHLAGAIDQMNTYGRIVCCGMISGYNDEQPKPGPDNLFKIIGKRIRMEGFIVRDHQDLQQEFIRQMSAWMKADKIHWEETITEGVENAPAAFINLFKGDKMGKALIKV